MKKFLTIGVLALVLLALPRQQASAWIKCNFSVGLNFNFESGNNCWLWGAFRNGQVPGYPTDAGCHGNNGNNGIYPYASPFGGSGIGSDYGYNGYEGDPGAAAHGAVPTGASQSPPQTNPPPVAKGNDSQTTSRGNAGYQPVGYRPQYPNYYQNSGYYGYGAGSYQQPWGSYGTAGVPSYWYGNN